VWGEGRWRKAVPGGAGNVRGAQASEAAGAAGAEQLNRPLPPGAPPPSQ